MAKKWGCSVSQLTNCDTGYHKKMNSPQEIGKTAEKLRILADSQNYSGKNGRSADSECVSYARAETS